MRDPKFLRYLDRELLLMVGGDQDAPELEWWHYDRIAQENMDHRRITGDWWISKYVRRFGREPRVEDRCWISGVQLYFVPWQLWDDLNRRTPWRCSREHLISGRHRPDLKVPNTAFTKGMFDPLVVPCGQAVNKSIGHIPLALKVLLKQELAKLDYDRDTPTYEAFGPVIEAVIDIQNQFKVEGKYPWQPETYEEGTRGRRMAESFCETMRALEREMVLSEEREIGVCPQRIPNLGLL